MEILHNFEGQKSNIYFFYFISEIVSNDYFVKTEKKNSFLDVLSKIGFV